MKFSTKKIVYINIQHVLDMFKIERKRKRKTETDFKLNFNILITNETFFCVKKTDCKHSNMLIAVKILFFMANIRSLNVQILSQS